MTVSRRRALAIAAGTSALLIPGVAAEGRPPPGKGKPPRNRTLALSDRSLGVDVRTINVTVGDPDAALMGWELTSSNVGLAALGIDGSSLPLYTGPAEVPTGTVISEKKITSPIILWNHTGIVLERCLIQPTTVNQGDILIYAYASEFTGEVPCTIRDCDIDSSHITNDQARAFCVGMHGLANMSRNYIHGGGGGFAVYSAGSHASAVIENNYVTDMFAWGDPGTTGNHVDAFTIRDFTNAVVPDRSLVIKNNRFDCDSGNATGAHLVQTTFGVTIANVDHHGNLFEGNGYNCSLEVISGGSAPNCTLTNNRWIAGTGEWYGYGYTSGGTWASQSENYVYNPAAPPDFKGAPITF